MQAQHKTLNHHLHWKQHCRKENLIINKYMKKNSTYRFQKMDIGFTLVETMVAISILSLSILATFTAVQLGISKSLYAKDQITAFYLGQEAFEALQNVRDQNGLANIT